jgi:hypothetical protein
MSPRFLFSVLGLALASVSSVVAQTASSNATVVRLMSWQGELTDLILDGGTTTVPAQADESLSNEYAVVLRKPVLRIFKSIPADGEARRIPQAEITIDPGITRAIILLIQAPAGSPLPLVGRVLDDSLEAQPVNSIRVLNLATRTVALRMGDETSSVVSGAEILFPYDNLTAPHVLFQLAVQTNGNWRIVRRNLQPIPRGQRVFCLLRDGRIAAGEIGPAAPPPPVQAFFMSSRTPSP